MLAILEFSHPKQNVIKVAYSFYANHVLPLLGGLISGSKEAYSYLPESISKFPRADALIEMIKAAGFAEVRAELLTGGIAALHCAIKQKS